MSAHSYVSPCNVSPNTVRYGMLLVVAHLRSITEFYRRTEYLLFYGRLRDFSGFHCISRENGRSRVFKGENRILREKMGFFGRSLDFTGENKRSWNFTGNYVILQ